MPDLSMESPHLASDTATVLTLGVAAPLRQLLTDLATTLPVEVEHCEASRVATERLKQLEVGCLVVSVPAYDSECLAALTPLLSSRSGVPILLVAEKPAPEWVIEAVRLGAFGVLEQPLEKEPFRTMLCDAIKQSKLTGNDRRLMADYHRRLDRLSQGESHVLEAIYAGRLNKQIARDLGVSIRTVEQRRQRVFRKMSVPSAVLLASYIATARTLERIYLSSCLHHPSIQVGDCRA